MGSTTSSRPTSFTQQVPGHPGVQSKTLSLKIKTRTVEKAQSLKARLTTKKQNKESKSWPSCVIISNIYFFPSQVASIPNFEHCCKHLDTNLCALVPLGYLQSEELPGHRWHRCLALPDHGNYFQISANLPVWRICSLCMEDPMKPRTHQHSALINHWLLLVSTV